MADQVPLFREAPNSEIISRQRQKDNENLAIKRKRYVLINLSLFYQQEGSFVLNFFNNVNYKVIKDRMQERGGDRFTWYGHVEGYEHSQIILVYEGGNVAGEIIVSDELYRIRPLEAGVHGIYEIDPSVLPPHADPIPVP